MVCKGARTEDGVSYDASEEGVLAIQFVRTVCYMLARLVAKAYRKTRTEGDKELRIVRVLGAIVCHPHQTSVNEPQARVYFILERLCRT